MAFYLAWTGDYLVARSTLLDGLPFGHGFSTRVTRSGAEVDLRVRKEDTSPGLAARSRYFGAVLPPGTHLALPHQVHSDRVLVVRRGGDGVAYHLRGEPVGALGYRVDADGVCAADPGLAVGVQTADCVPVLIADPVRGVCAAVHSGWRGTMAGIAAVAVRTLAEAFGSDPADLRAAVGPSIQGCCYEVDGELGRRFGEAFAGSVRGGKGEGSPCRLDLGHCIAAALEGAGVAACRIDRCRLCTRCDARYFHSYRRTGPSAGRMISFLFPVVEDQAAGPGLE
ncbi:MAG: peptidoglycan editing factor PgeF [Acidobacteria bacterium]|nr:peptidoglycan editing factor PgeF [Acidobacteriota bacterium]